MIQSKWKQLVANIFKYLGILLWLAVFYFAAQVFLAPEKQSISFGIAFLALSMFFSLLSDLLNDRLDDKKDVIVSYAFLLVLSLAWLTVAIIREA